MKYFLAALLMASMAFQVSCGSKEKKEDAPVVEAGDVDSDPGVESKDISFDPLGSDSGNISGLQTVNFDYDKSTLTSSARKALADNAEWIKSNSGVTVQVEGHCDERGSVEYNLALGERRAKSVKNYLVSLGVDPKKMTIISYGKEKPLENGDSESAYSKNRRANFVPLPQ